MSPLKCFKYESNQLWDMGDGGYIYIDSYVLETISSYLQHTLKAKEAGGFLAGYYKGKDIHVINLTVPMQDDMCGRRHFKRRDLAHVEQIKKWYGESKGEVNCLGEWHTHPESYPRPSSIDKNGWRIFNQSRQGQKAIFLIAGTLDVWVGGY